jgi:integrase
MTHASVYQRPGRRVWYVSYWDAGHLGRIHKATPYRVDDPAGHRNVLRMADNLTREAQAINGATQRELWGAWVPQFLEDRYRSSPKTLTRYKGSWCWVRTFLAENNVRTPGALKYQHVLTYVGWRTAMRRHNGNFISRNTALCEVKGWSIIMREAIRRGYAFGNPCERLGIKKDAPHRPPELTVGEIDKIRAEVLRVEGSKPVTERWMTVSFEIALHQGCRLSETQVPMDAIDLDRRTIRFAAKGRDGGEPHVFTTALHPALIPLVTELQAAGAAFTCRLPRMAAKEWWALRKRIGLEHTKFHSTRVTVITRLARAGVPESQAMAYVGHASQTIHHIYQRLRAEDLSLCTQALAFDGRR